MVSQYFYDQAADTPEAAWNSALWSEAQLQRAETSNRRNPSEPSEDVEPYRERRDQALASYVEDTGVDLAEARREVTIGGRRLWHQLADDVEVAEGAEDPLLTPPHARQARETAPTYRHIRPPESRSVESDELGY